MQFSILIHTMLSMPLLTFWYCLYTMETRQIHSTSLKALEAGLTREAGKRTDEFGEDAIREQ